MGLEVVELIMRIEDEFHFKISNAEASKTSTLGDLYKIILRHLKCPENKGCEAGQAFYALRDAILDTIGVDRRHVRPSTPWSALIPPKQIKTIWWQLQKRLDHQLPPLERSRRIERLVLGVIIVMTPVIALLFAAVVLVLKIGSPMLLTVALVFVIIASFAGIWKLSEPLCDTLPAWCVTVRDACYAIARLRHKKNALPTRSISPREAWEILRAIVAEEFHVPRESLKQETRFMEDLDAG